MHRDIPVSSRLNDGVIGMQGTVAGTVDDVVTRRKSTMHADIPPISSILEFSFHTVWHSAPSVIFSLV